MKGWEEKVGRKEGKKERNKKGWKEGNKEGELPPISNQTSRFVLNCLFQQV
jgi:hypothetical protein